ncbi:hypothetical protein BKA82DRAFT_35140 [Pisolithus tinctorius]|uniref:Uncharacterized protein n=1 Tax=Pisolithus tinctorius Marx 270 TaxID=870435 RepID=A0A0C3IBE1_PISTI|nr:hypothetical protein BKA82DRAFT_35140 [Pisolithus tinctorius]KIN94367.1 hypothetical protein M404DRAFT_35140 [Pisolithus tinctorius Marx 270]
MSTHGKQVIQGPFHACSVCEKPYNPDKAEQRYCRTCKNWFHCSCLQKLAKGSTRPLDITKEVLNGTGLSLQDIQAETGG